ncbi:WD40-repeat-containing domain protein [Cubamyces menziesii]|nr:WD40-repeat-containing domain protein [Cubamyces menziesii]
MKYRQVRTFSGTHTQGITQVSFSFDGMLLASSDLSGKLCIWHSESGDLLHVYAAGTSVLSLKWLDSVTIMCGLADGTIVRLGFGEEVHVDGKWCHAYPVEHLAISGGMLASGAHHEVFVWEISQGKCSPFALSKMEQPTASDDEEVLVTGLHWGMNHDRWRTLDILLITYMSQGIFVYNAQDWSILRQFSDPDLGFMASSSLSPDGFNIAVANMVNGFDVYDLDTGAVVLSLFHKVGKEYPVPVQYVHGGNAILGGSTVGMLDLWYVEGTLSRKMQTLSAHYNIECDQFLIAAGVISDNPESPVTLWKAEEGRSRGESLL